MADNGFKGGKVTSLVDPKSIPKTVSNIFQNEAIIAVLAASILSPLLVPKITELVSNLEFGGKEGNILYVTATSSLYSMELNQIGAKYIK